jgi:hypothetical protein
MERIGFASLTFDMRGAQKAQPFGHPLDGRVRRHSQLARSPYPIGKEKIDSRPDAAARELVKASVNHTWLGSEDMA